MIQLLKDSQYENTLISESLSQSIENHVDCIKSKEKYENATTLSIEMKALNLMLERKSSKDLLEMQVAVVHEMRLSNYDPQQLAVRAKGLLNYILMH